jgi:hypothetical protein
MATGFEKLCFIFWTLGFEYKSCSACVFLAQIILYDYMDHKSGGADLLPSSG